MACASNANRTAVACGDDDAILAPVVEVRLVDDALQRSADIGGRSRDVHAHIGGAIAAGKREVAARRRFVEAKDAVLRGETHRDERVRVDQRVDVGDGEAAEHNGGVLRRVDRGGRCEHGGEVPRVRQCDDDAAAAEAIEATAHHGPLCVGCYAEEAPLQVRLVLPRGERQRELPHERLRHAHEAVASHAGGAVRPAVDDEAYGERRPALGAPRVPGARGVRSVVEERHRVRKLHGGVADEDKAGGGVRDVEPRVAERRVRRVARGADALVRANRGGGDGEGLANDGERAARDEAVRRGGVAPPQRHVLAAPRAPLQLNRVDAAADAEQHVAVQAAAAVRDRGHAQRGAGLRVRHAVEEDACGDVVAARERIERPRPRRHDVERVDEAQRPRARQREGERHPFHSLPHAGGGAHRDRGRRRGRSEARGHLGVDKPEVAMERGDDERATPGVAAKQRGVARPRPHARARRAPLQLDDVRSGVDLGVEDGVELALNGARRAHWARVRAGLAVRLPVHHDARRDVVAQHATRRSQRVPARNLRRERDEEQRVGRGDRRGVGESKVRRHRWHVAPYAAASAERRRLEGQPLQLRGGGRRAAVVGGPY